MMISRVVVSMLRPKVCCASRIVLAVWGGRHRAVVPNRCAPPLSTGACDVKSHSNKDTSGSRGTEQLCSPYVAPEGHHHKETHMSNENPNQGGQQNQQPGQGGQQGGQEKPGQQNQQPGQGGQQEKPGQQNQQPGQGGQQNQGDKR